MPFHLFQIVHKTILTSADATCRRLVSFLRMMHHVASGKPSKLVEIVTMLLVSLVSLFFGFFVLPQSNFMQDSFFSESVLDLSIKDVLLSSCSKLCRSMLGCMVVSLSLFFSSTVSTWLVVGEDLIGRLGKYEDSRKSLFPSMVYL